MSATNQPNLETYDWIAVSSSGGKDSQAQLDHVNNLVKRHQIPAHRVVVVHADLGRAEWEGTKEIAQRQAEAYGYRFAVVSNKRDLLERIEARGMWPSNGQRYCTGEFKRNPIRTLFTQLAQETRDQDKRNNVPQRRVRILNCIGIRAEESPARAKKTPFVIDEETTITREGKVQQNSRRQVDTWFPIFDWTLEQVWTAIKQSGVEHHYAYDLGMPRVSCVLCIFAPQSALLLAGYLNPTVLDAYAQAETRMGHTFTQKTSLVTIQNKLAAGYVPQHVPANEWSQCA